MRVVSCRRSFLAVALTVALTITACFALVGHRGTKTTTVTAMTGAAVAFTGATGLQTCAPYVIAAENRRTGSDGWNTPAANTPPATPVDVSGYADQTSVACGDELVLRLAPRANRSVMVRVEAWRLGFYGGAGGRRVWVGPLIRVGVPHTYQQSDPTTLIVTAPWPVSTSFRIGPLWVPGVYLLKIVPSDHDLSGGVIPLVVTDPGRSHELVQVLATNTWQMYNSWGDRSAYVGIGGPSQGVSFERPYSGSGAGQLISDEYPLIKLVEQMGLNIGYATDNDLNSGDRVVTRTKALIFGSHSEYWTSGMRSNFEVLLRRGVNAAFLGANNMYWRPRPMPSSRSYRTLALYRYSVRDPLRGDPGLVSGEWRYPPINDPEAFVLGNQYGCAGVDVPMSLPTHLGWIFSHSGGAPGQRLPHMWFQETDSEKTRPGTRIVASTRFYCALHHENSGGAMTEFAHAGGGLIIKTGTRGWVCRLSASCSNPNPVTDRIISRATKTILRAVTHGPAGWRARIGDYPIAKFASGASAKHKRA